MFVIARLKQILNIFFDFFCNFLNFIRLIWLELEAVSAKQIVIFNKSVFKLSDNYSNYHILCFITLYDRLNIIELNIDFT